jgi:hypothetical protein
MPGKPPDLYERWPIMFRHFPQTWSNFTIDIPAP